MLSDASAFLTPFQITSARIRSVRSEGRVPSVVNLVVALHWARVLQASRLVDDAKPTLRRGTRIAGRCCLSESRTAPVDNVCGVLGARVSNGVKSVPLRKSSVKNPMASAWRRHGQNVVAVRRGRDDRSCLAQKALAATQDPSICRGINQSLGTPALRSKGLTKRLWDGASRCRTMSSASTSEP